MTVVCIMSFTWTVIYMVSVTRVESCSSHLSLALFRRDSLIAIQWFIQCACGFRDRGRVVFFAPTVALVRQQHEEFKRWFSALKVDYLVGPELEEKAEINVMLKNNQVRVIA